MDISVLNKTGKHADSKPATVIIPQKEAYDRQTHIHFKQQIQTMTRAQKNDNLDDHLEVFEETKRMQEMRASQEQHEEDELEIKIKVSDYF